MTNNCEFSRKISLFKKDYLFLFILALLSGSGRIYQLNRAIY